jgi:hypothetical protein
MLYNKNDQTPENHPVTEMENASQVQDANLYTKDRNHQQEHTSESVKRLYQDFLNNL